MTDLPLGLLVGLAATAGVALGPVGVLVSIMVGAAFLILDATGRDDLRPGLVALVLVAVTASVGMTRGEVATPVTDPRMESAVGFTVVIRSMPQSSARFDTALADIERFELSDGMMTESTIPVLVSVPRAYRVNSGDIVDLRGSFTPLDGLEPGYRRYVSGRGAAGTVLGYDARIVEHGSSLKRLLVDLRRDLADRLRRAIPGDAGELAAGIVTGDDSGLSDDAAGAFQTVGLSHLTAVSGQNIAMLAGLAMLLLHGLPARRAMLAHAGSLLLVWLYVGMTGFGPPAIRAGLFVTLGLLALRVGRRPDYLTMLALASGGMLLAEPSYAESVSFWLSMAASAALVTAFGLPTGGVRNWAVRSMSAMVSAQLATVPVSIAVFGTWSVGSIPANLVAGPLMQVAFPLCFLLAPLLLLLPGIAPILAIAAEAPLAATIATAETLAGVFPAQDLAAGGVLVVTAAAIPCGFLIALMSEDVRRWWSRQRGILAGTTGSIVSLGLGLALGVVIALFVAVIG